MPIHQKEVWESTVDNTANLVRFPWPLRLLFASRPDALSYVYVLELGRNKFEGPASDFDDLEKAFWVA